MSARGVFQAFRLHPNGDYVNPGGEMSLAASNYRRAAAPFVPGDSPRGPAGLFNLILAKTHSLLSSKAV